jgi:hypothetical protein
MNEARTALRAAKVFREAAMYIRQYGWQRSGMSQHGKPRCSMGALASAHPAKLWDTHLSQLMYEELYDVLDGLSLTEFNYKYNDGEKVAQLFEDVATKLCCAHRLSIEIG